MIPVGETGSGWTLLDGLQDAHPGTVPLAGDLPHHRSDRATPSVKKVGQPDGFSVVCIAFRDGDVMADHRTARPVLVMGQTGQVEVTVAGGPSGGREGRGDGGGGRGCDATVTLGPGQALGISAGRVHSLRATGPATVTLLIPGGPVSDDGRTGGTIMT